jgi:hypothetical protein
MPTPPEPNFASYLNDEPRHDGVAVTVGADHVYISSDVHNAVYVFDPLTLAYQFKVPIAHPRGVAVYHGELYVATDPYPASGQMSVDVFSPSGAFHRRLPLCVVQSADVCQALAADTDDQLLGGPIMGVTVAWNEVWVAFGAGVAVVDDQTGAVKTIEPGVATTMNKDAFCSCTPYHGRDISVVPEVNAALTSGGGALFRSDIFGSLVLNSIDDSLSNEKYVTGSDSVWGMKWYLTTSYGTVTEYSVNPAPSSTPGLPPSVGLHQEGYWFTAPDGCLETCTSETATADVTYQRRETRIDWAGDLRSSEWMRGTRCLSYTVSDADVYVVGNGAQRWLEPARNFTRIDLRVDGTVVTSSTLPNGQLCVDTNTFSNGAHTLDLQAYTSGMPTASVTNPTLRLDHLVPTGQVDAPPKFVRGEVTLTGSLTDEHAGPRDRQLQRSQGGAWSPICDLQTPAANGPTYQCIWQTSEVPDGPYTIRAHMRDLVGSSFGGANEADSGVVQTTVDNTPPAITMGGLNDDAAAGAVPDGNHALHIHATDGQGSGVATIEVRVDNNVVDSWNPGCASGGCDRDRDFVYRNDSYGEGIHSVEVTAIDALGQASRKQFQVDTQTRPQLSLGGPFTDDVLLHDGTAYPLTVGAQDAGSGVVALSVKINGVEAASAAQSCTGGACSLQREFSMTVDTLGTGEHLVDVSATDAAGNRTTRSYTIEVEIDDGIRATPPEDSTSGPASPSTSTRIATPAGANVPNDPGIALLPCTSSSQPANFPVFSFGPQFEDLPVTYIGRDCEPPVRNEPTRANLVTYIYGDCVAADGGSCLPPLEVQSWPACERNLSTYLTGPDNAPMPHVETTVQGAPAAIFDDGERLEIFTATTTVVIFGDDPALVSRAALSLRQEPLQTAPGTFWAPKRSSSLSAPAAGSITGGLTCAGSQALLTSYTTSLTGLLASGRKAVDETKIGTLTWIQQHLQYLGG